MALNSSARYNVFPEDLGSSYYGHWMTITAFESNGAYTGVVGNNTPGYSVNQSPAYTAVLYIPGGGGAGDSGVYYQDTHEYTDIKLSNLVGGAIGGFISGLTGSTTAGNFFGSIMNKGAALAGKPINPGVEVLYQTTDRRSFNFSFLLAPSSEKESNELQNIIYQLRRHAAPKLSSATGGMTMQAPSEFAIKFFHNNQENDNIPKIRRCILNRVTVQYTPSGEWSTFSNGHPVAVMLMLDFQELEIIHRDFVDQGF